MILRYLNLSDGLREKIFMVLFRDFVLEKNIRIKGFES